MEGMGRRTPRYFGDGKGRVLSEEGRAAENVYIQKMERERMEKLRRKAEKERLEAEKAESEKVSKSLGFLSIFRLRFFALFFFSFFLSDSVLLKSLGSFCFLGCDSSRFFIRVWFFLLFVCDSSLLQEICVGTLWYRITLIYIAPTAVAVSVRLPWNGSRFPKPGPVLEPEGSGCGSDHSGSTCQFFIISNFKII